MDEEPLYVLTEDAWERFSKATVRSERDNRGLSEAAVGPQGNTAGIIVQVTGAPIVPTTTTATSTSSSSTTSTSSTTPCLGNTTSSTTSTSDPIKRLYPGVFVYRNIDSITNQAWYHKSDEICWIQEVNDQGLGLGCYYTGEMMDQYRGVAVIGVHTTGNNVSCSGASTTTTCACSGLCTWELQGVDPVWIRLEDCYFGATSSTTSTTTTTINCSPYECRYICRVDSVNWELYDYTCIGGCGCEDSIADDSCDGTGKVDILVSIPCNMSHLIHSGVNTTSSTTTTTTSTPMDCDCPPPDFCPADDGCAITFTFCYHGFVQSEDELPYCTSSTSSSSTTSHTTTTPDPTGCGTGCVYIMLPSSGGLVPYQTFSDCNVGATISGGWTCEACLGPAVFGVPCAVVIAPCTLSPPEDLPPPCGGICTWLWPGFDGGWWINIGTGGCSGFTPPGPCDCPEPNYPGDGCGTVVYTPCFTEAIPVPPGGGGSGPVNPPVNPNSCGNYCQTRWDATSNTWVVIQNCGAGCYCPDPPFVGADDDCVVMQMPCQPNSLTSTSTSTSSTTSTSTTTPDCSAGCQWLCNFGIDTMGKAVGIWELATPCAAGCYCHPLTYSCIEAIGTFVISSTCSNVTGSSSTTSSTTTTFPISGLCPGNASGCVYICVNQGNSPLGNPVLGWVLCSNTGNCRCTTPLIVSPLGHCTSTADIGTIIHKPCS